MTLRLQFGQDLARKLVIALVERLLGALQARPDASRIKNLTGFVTQRLLQSLGKLPGTRKTVPGLLGHRFVDNPAHERADRGVQLAGRRGYVMQDRLKHAGLSGPIERPTLGQRLIAHYAQRENV